MPYFIVVAFIQWVSTQRRQVADITFYYYFFLKICSHSTTLKADQLCHTTHICRFSKCKFGKKELLKIKFECYSCWKFTRWCVITYWWRTDCKTHKVGKLISQGQMTNHTPVNVQQAFILIFWPNPVIILFGFHYRNKNVYTTISALLWSYRTFLLLVLK